MAPLSGLRAALALLLLVAAGLLAGCSTMPAPGVWQDDTTRGSLPANVEWRSMGADGLDLTKKSEAYRGKPYDDPVGFCTVGYGHLIKKARCDGSEPAEFLPRVSEPVATDLLREDLQLAEYPLLLAISPQIVLTQTQFDALCDFVFNVGARNFRQSQLLVAVNAGEFHRVPDQFRRWIYASKRKLPGLVTRREREIELFLRGVTLVRGPVAADEDLSPIDIGTGQPPAR
jgi:GH24 family phage-related lysozyme (muramidase)